MCFNGMNLDRTYGCGHFGSRFIGSIFAPIWYFSIFANTPARAFVGIAFSRFVSNTAAYVYVGIVIYHDDIGKPMDLGTVFVLVPVGFFHYPL